MAPGKKDRSLVLAFARVLPPSDGRSALPTSMSFEGLEVEREEREAKTYDVIDRALQYIYGLLWPLCLRHIRQGLSKQFWTALCGKRDLFELSRDRHTIQ
jgi:hypothetical protein